MDEAVQFFYEHAGYNIMPGESEFQARMRCAVVLAGAERRLKDGPFYVDREPDRDPWDADVPWDGPVWVVSLWSVVGSVESEHVGSVGQVGCEGDSPYLRVLAAELAAEYIPA